MLTIDLPHVGAQTWKQAEHASDDWDYYIDNCKELLDHSITRHGVHTRTTIRTFCGVRVWIRHLSAWCLDHASVLRVQEDGQVLLRG
jgi:hypothetical protein